QLRLRPSAQLPVQRSDDGVVRVPTLSNGAAPFWTPLRFPGQYFDAETDLFENWNRHYSPSSGRYLGPEPLLNDTEYAADMATDGQSVTAYAYAFNNPLHYVDTDGLSSTIPMDSPDDWVMLPLAGVFVLWCALNPEACNELLRPQIPSIPNTVPPSI